MSSEEEDKKRMWIKYYCEECKAWETREAKKLSPSSLSSLQQQASESTLWSWGCVKQIHHGALQTFRVDQLNVDAELEADAVAAPFKLDFPSIESSPATAQQELLEQKSTEAVEQSVDEAALSNGSSKSKRPKRNSEKSSTYAPPPRGDVSVAEATSPVNSQGGVTSSSPDEVLLDENGDNNINRSLKNASQDEPTAAAAPPPPPTADPESPAVIDAEHHENGIRMRPRRLTAGDRGLAQALQYEKPPRVVAATKPLSEINNVKPSSESSPAGVKRPKRVLAGLRGLILSAENSKSAPKGSPKKQKTDDVHGVRTRSTAKKASKKNRKIGDLY